MNRYSALLLLLLSSIPCQCSNKNCVHTSESESILLLSGKAVSLGFLKSSIQAVSQDRSFVGGVPGAADLSLPYFTYNDSACTKMGGEVPLYPCDQCDKVFTRPYYCKRHKEAVHDRITHSCVCGRIYNYATGLQRHQKCCASFISSCDQAPGPFSDHASGHSG